jgi:hypothetical protein
MPREPSAVNSLNVITPTTNKDGMIVHPAVIVHGLADAKAALDPNLPVTMLSAPGAAQFAGCLWWHEIVLAAKAEHPNTPMISILDCADASGLALSALRSGVVCLVLWPSAPRWQAVAAIATSHGGFVMRQAPPALDLSGRNAIRQLAAWLRPGSSAPSQSSSAPRQRNSAPQSEQRPAQSEQQRAQPDLHHAPTSLGASAEPTDHNKPSAQ